MDIILQSYEQHNLIFKIDAKKFKGVVNPVPGKANPPGTVVLNGQQAGKNITIIPAEAFEFLKENEQFAQLWDRRVIVQRDKLPDNFINAQQQIANAKTETEKAKAEYSKAKEELEKKEKEIEALKRKLEKARIE